MTLGNLIKKYDPDKVMIFVDERGWSNIDIVETESNLEIHLDCSRPFSDE